MTSLKKVIGIIFILSSYYLHCSAQCNLAGFSFSEIAATSFTATWVPPGTTGTQTLNYAPCSPGIPGGCGTQGPPTNQCANSPNCCAVCQTWIEDMGPTGACLGKGKNLITVESTSSSSVRISYGGGDVVDTTPRQVDIDIKCDPTASVLTFASFVPAVPKIPAPPAYTYSLTLTSSVLCGGSGISGGSIFLIVLFGGIILYFLGGVLFNKFQQQKEGIEVIPNVEFWKEVPGYLLDGVMFTKSKIMSIVSPQSL